MDGALKPKEREKWARLAAYIAQTINTILHSHDTVAIEETLEKLNRYVEKHVGLDLLDALEGLLQREKMGKLRAKS